MPDPESFQFGAFRLDSATGRVWHGRRPIVMPPKAFTLLELFLRRIRSLVASGRVEEIRLGPLPEDAVAEHLGRRFPGHDLPADLARSLHRSPGGHPLFFIAALEDAVAERRIEEGRGGWSIRGDSTSLAARVPRGVRELVRLRRELALIRPTG